MKTALSVILLLTVVLSLPATSFAAWKVFILETMHVPVVEEHSRLIQEYLQAAAADRDRNLQIKSYNADGKMLLARKALDAALKDFRPDLVISVATLASQVTAKTLKGTDVPHLFCVVADPVGGGIIPEAGPDKNHLISGLVYGVDRKTVVETATRIISSKATNDIIRLGFVFSTYPSAISDYKGYLRELEGIAGVEVVALSIPYLDGETGMKTMLERSAELINKNDDYVDYWWQVKGPLAEDPGFQLLFKKSGKPLLFGNNIGSVRHGAIFTISQQTSSTSRELANLSMAVLEGRPVKDFAIGYPKSFYAAVNLSSAERFGLSIPADFIESAGENVFRSEQ